MGGALMTLATFLKHVPNNQYVEFAAYQLSGEAQQWWQEECRLLQLQNADIPWDVFQMAFYKKYFPESAREAKKMELMQLKQGSLSITDYTSRFEELCRFSRVCQGAPKTYESWKCIKYQRSLKDNIMTAVATLEIRIFSDLMNKARVIEEYTGTLMATRGRGRTRSRESRNEQPADNHAEFMATIANLTNTMEANTVVTLQAVQRLGQSAGNVNGNSEGNTNDNA
ncbi:uncharacterized protein LOC107640841 [Arachis ipaensis]|uniref:uncharacterized protein LOC107640841 n=1 Tax=Arachis ipaensis TaxID=130454 RepID=UPI0007AF0364|nr:uncharacterized protein LOC107640841 [Arachis ipaensis]